MSLVLLAAILLFAGAVLSLAVPGHRVQLAVALATQTVATGCVLAAVTPVLATGQEQVGAVAWSYPLELIRMRVDPLSALFLAGTMPLTVVGTLYAAGYLRPSLQAGRHAGSHLALINLSALSFLIIYTVENALVFLIGWELAAVAAWLLIIWDYRSQKVRFAGFNYLVSTHVGLFVLVAAFMVMHSQTDSMDFTAFGGFLRTPSALRDATFLLLLGAFSLKSGFFPLHTWQPRAYSAAPAHVSALMSIHKAGLFALLRFTLLVERPPEWMGWALIGFSALSALIGALYTTAQRDLSRLLGYSSTENVGVAGLGFGLGFLGLSWGQPLLVQLGFAGGMFQVLNHAVLKGLLFYASGSIHRATRTMDLERLGGLARPLPRTAFFFLLGGLGLAGLPPLNGFFSELLVYAGLFSTGVPNGQARLALTCVAGLLALVGAVSAVAVVRAFGVVFLGTPRDPHVASHGEAPRAMTGAMVLQALAVAALSLAPGVALWLVRPATALFLQLPPVATAPGPPDLAAVLAPVERVFAWLVVLIGALAALAFLAQRSSRRHRTWGCGYSAPNPRMQYTGTSFSSQLTGVFDAFVPQLRREHLPQGYFPQDQGHLTTHHPDAVERRMFEVLGEGESVIRQLAGRIPEQPRFAFAAGLVGLLLIVGMLLAAAAAAPAGGGP